MKPRLKFLLYAALVILGGTVLYILEETIRLKNTGFRTKTLWDWMELFIIPLVLAGGAFYLQRSERAVERQAAEDRAELEREIATDRQREAALQAYIDRIAELLLKEKLRTTDTPEVRDVARTRTVSVMRGLDVKRNNIVIQFLREANLILDNNSILKSAKMQEMNLQSLSLYKANLEGVNLQDASLLFANLDGANLVQANLLRANLEGATLRRANLESAFLLGANLLRVNLGNANLDGANLEGAKLESAYLLGANLRNANLDGANLVQANLMNVNLEGGYLQETNLQGTNLMNANLRAAKLESAYLQDADLRNADLRNAKLEGASLLDADLLNANLEGASLQDAKVTEVQLAQAKSLKGATMPDGKRHE